MVEAYRSHRRRTRSEHVGRVQPAAESRFDHGDVDVLSHEPLEREGSSQLEEGRAYLFRRGNLPLEKLEHGLFRDRSAIDGNPLAEVDEVR